MFRLEKLKLDLVIATITSTPIQGQLLVLSLH